MKSAAKSLRGLLYKIHQSQYPHSVQTDKTNSLIKFCTAGAQNISCLKASLKVPCTFANVRTNLDILTFVLQEGSCIEAERRRSSVPPDHNASFRLSVSLGTYLNKRWLTSSYTLHLSPTESSESWQGLLWSYTIQRRFLFRTEWTVGEPPFLWHRGKTSSEWTCRKVHITVISWHLNPFPEHCLFVSYQIIYCCSHLHQKTSLDRGVTIHQFT